LFDAYYESHITLLFGKEFADAIHHILFHFHR
jgi:hypothetical protein